MCKNKYIFCIIDEIINHQQVLNYSIHKLVTIFLLSNPEFFLLKDSLDNYFEIPLVVYTGESFIQSQKNLIYKPYKQSIQSLFGSYYYFFTNEKAIEYATTTKTPGITRYCIFTLNTNIIKNPQTNYKLGDFNSLYIGKIQINTYILNDSPIWVIKNSTQINPLSAHLLDSI